MRSVCASAIVVLLALGSSAYACHVSGAVYCDENTNGVVDIPGDLPIPGVTVGATSLDLMSGQYTATTDASGSYDIVLPTQSDRYLVGPIGLPAGLTVVVPSGGTYTAQIVVDTAQDHVDGLDFLVQGCAPTTTSTSTTTTTTSTTTTTTVRAFQCYEVDHARFSLTGLNLSNEFGTSVAALSRPKRLCNPASIDGDDPAAPSAPGHLVGYSLVQTSPPPVPIRDVHVTNALGSFVVEVLRPTRLLVPSAKSLAAPPAPLAPSVLLDHFECYRVRGAGPKNSRSITMQDQFVTAGEKIMQIQQLCVPVDDGGGITNPASKLTCYRTKYTGASFRGPGTPVFVNNEFGSATLESSHGEELCLPSSPSGAFVDGGN